MDVQAYAKAVRISPRKARDVARCLSGRKAEEALEILRLTPRKAARLLAKTLQSAIANAENNHNLTSGSLTIRNAIVEQGPAFRRHRVASRGRVHPYHKWTSHLRIILTDE
jgi:large subunit ribosomal protein L22